jgi:hypothetical protein
LSTLRATLRVRCLMSMRSKRPSDQAKLPLLKRLSHLINQVLTSRWKGQYGGSMVRNIKETAASCFISRYYQCMMDIQKRVGYCINTHSLMVQSIDSPNSICIFTIRMDKRFTLIFVKSNYSITYGWNG